MPLLCASWWRIAASGLVLLVGGCATLSPDGGTKAVHDLVAARTGDRYALPDRATSPASPSEAVRELLAAPLTPETAVQVALYSNPGLKASLAELGIAEADLLQARRLANPRFTFSDRRGGDMATIERSVLVNVMSLVTMPLAQRVAGRQLEAAQLEAAARVLRLIGDTRRTYLAAVAAQQSTQYFEQARLAAEAGADLAQKMAAAGNFSKLAQMQEQAFLADTTTRLARAKQTAASQRERLIRLLSLSGQDAAGFRLPDRLPELPKTVIESGDAEQRALEQRIDVALAKHNAEATAANLGLVKTTGFINVLETGYSNESNSGERRMDGSVIEVQLPLFDWGDAKVARAQAIYMQSVARAAEVAVTAQSEVRDAYQAYRTTYDIAKRYRDEIVPLRRRIADENQLRYNGMLLSVFELLADAREQVASVNAAIEALRDFWIADANLQLAQNGGTPGGGALAAVIAPPANSRTEH